jgi:hypothetical protein
MAEVTVSAKTNIKDPGKLNIYRLGSVTVDRQALNKLGHRLGHTSDAARRTITETASRLSDSNGEWTLSLFHLSGGWKFRNDHLWQADDGKGNLKLEDEAAHRLALEQIKKYTLADDKESRLLRVTRLHVAHSERGKPENNERIIDVGVVLERVVDGLPVEGPGGKTVVYFNHERAFIGIDHLWRDIEKVHEPVKKLRPVDYAIEQVRRRYHDTGPGRVDVTQIRLGYFEANFYQLQEYLQPAYIVFVRLISPDERIQMPSVFAFPAAENSVGTIEPEPRPPVRQTPRKGENK